jgi:Pvc16 N-terminal domain/IPT/TIG domain
MSDFLAVAGVSSVLRWILLDALASSGLDTVLGATPTVTALPPDRIVVGDTENPQLNLFMYHVALNPAWRNVELPERDSTGRRLSSPPLALDLHYLLSAYGRHELDGEILLGWAMQLLHEQSTLTRDFVQNALAASSAAPGASSEAQAVGLTTLADQAELVKLTPQPFTTEDTYKLWTAFQARYRTTAAYVASVVLIQRSRPVRVSLPVQTRNILVQPLERPVITDVTPAMAEVGEVLTIQGRHFVGEAPSDTMVRFDDGAPIAPDLVRTGGSRHASHDAAGRGEDGADQAQHPLWRTDRPARRTGLQPRNLHAVAHDRRAASFRTSRHDPHPHDQPACRPSAARGGAHRQPVHRDRAATALRS